MNFFIISSHKFPYGGAQTNRIISIAKGLAQIGNKVTVLQAIPYIKDENNNKKNGFYNEINFKYFMNGFNSLKITHKLFNRMKSVISIFNIVNHLRLNKTKNDVLIVQDNFISHRIVLYLFSRIHKIPMIRDEGEYPDYLIYHEISMFRSLLSRLDTFLEARLFDGLLLISTALFNFYKKRVLKRVKLKLIPLTVETHRFIKNTVKQKQKYICYCGYMGGNKDGVPILINAFALIANKHKDVNLVLIGSASPTEINAINKQINKFDLASRIILTGQISRDEIPDYLCNASALALARPKNKQAEGGLPTKLGEYLATGNPVIVTNVGDIPVYLGDKVNAFIAEPSSAESFAKKIDEVFSDYLFAQNVGQAGQKIANSTFNYIEQAKNIVNFIDTDILG